MTSPAQGVLFDLWANGQQRRFSWTDGARQNGLLALDRNHNGLIDHGAELFGSAAPQPAVGKGEIRNGFRALAEYDKRTNGGNEDGMVDSKDAIFTSLLLWQDRNHNGVSEGPELAQLRDFVSRIDLHYTPARRIDEYGNVFYLKSRVWNPRGDHDGRFTYDVYLQLLP